MLSEFNSLLFTQDDRNNIFGMVTEVSSSYIYNDNIRWSSENDVMYFYDGNDLALVTQQILQNHKVLNYFKNGEKCLKSLLKCLESSRKGSLSDVDSICFLLDGKIPVLCLVNKSKLSLGGTRQEKVTNPTLQSELQLRRELLEDFNIREKICNLRGFNLVVDLTMIDLALSQYYFVKMSVLGVILIVWSCFCWKVLK